MNKRKILALLLAVVMICSLFVSPALAADDEGIVAISDTAAPKFTDVKDHWAESAINRWAEEGIVKGDGDGTVQPARNLRRAELATILTRLLGLKDRAAANTFSDVTANDWYADAVLKCAKAGIMLGDGTGKANPEAPITRQEAIVMIGRAVGVKPATGSSLDRFQDGGKVASWAAPYMIALTDMDILSGLPVDGGFVIAPNEDINRASTFTLLDKAIAKYVTGPSTVTVDDANKFVIINSAAEETGTVTVTGKAAGVVVATGTTDEVVLKNAAVGTVKVDAPVDVIISRGSNVTDLDANAAAVVTNNGTVTNLNTNADDVTFDGNKPSKVNTAEGVKPATDAKGNEVTDKPASSGGSTGSTSYKYRVSVDSAVGGKVTADVTRTNTANTVVTLTVTPDAQTADALPYVLKSLTVKNGETEVTVTDNQFTMDTEGTYTVTAEFVQPITDAELFIVKDEASYNRLKEFGYSSENEAYELTTLAEKPWLAMCAKKTEGYTGGSIALTANGNAVNNWPYGDKVYTYSTVYVNVKDDVDDTTDVLGLSGAAYHFVADVTFAGLSYTFECDYVKPGVDESTLHTVTFKTSTGTELVSYKAAQGETVTAPAAPAIDGYYFTGWDTALTDNQFTVGEADATVTAEYVEIGGQELKTRPNGPANNGETDCNYGEVYAAAGVTLTGTPAEYTYTIDATTFLNYADTQDNKLGVLAATVGEKTYYFYGVAIMAPADATALVLTKDNALTSLDNADKRTEFDLANSEHSFTIGDQKCILHYFGAVADKDSEGVYGFQPDGAFTRYAKWVKEDGTILAVNKLDIKRETVNIPVTYTVTFGTTEVETGYDGKLAEIPAVPTKDGYTGKWVVDGEEVTTDTVFTADAAAEAVYTPNFTVTFEAMSDDVYALYAAADGFKDNIPAFADFGAVEIGSVEDGVAALTGELKAITTPWTGFNTVVEKEQTGYYLLFQFEAPASAKTAEGVIVKTAKNEFTAANLDEVDGKQVFSFIWWLAEPTATALENETVELTIDWDGNGGKIGTKYTLDLSGLTLKAAEATPDENA